jgi:hypothetical protein
MLVVPPTRCPKPPRDLRDRAARFAAADWMPSTDPLEVLALSRPLRDGLRSYEEQLVRVARKRGESWTAIARSLGITQQAAHRAYAYEKKERH